MISRTQFFDKVLPGLLPWIFLMGNLLVAVGTELAHDEAYYWLYSENLAWGYFDHPPMVAWLIHLSSWIPGELGVRLGGILCLQGAVVLLARLVPLSSRSTLWWGFNIFPLLALVGSFAVPDTPLVIFSCLWLWGLKRALDDDSLANAALLGLLTALLLYSKYHGVLFLAGTLLALPRLVLRKSFWLTTLVALLSFAPHIHWQWAHDLATFRYHFVDRPGVPFGFKQPLIFLVIQFLLVGPFLGVVIWRAILKEKTQNDFERALKVMALFVIGFFFISTFNKKLEANWTIAAGVPILLYLVLRVPVLFQSRELLSASLLLILVVRLIMVAPPSWHSLKRAHEIHGWKSWVSQIKRATPNCFLVANSYQVASKLSFYLKERVPALNVRTRLNQFEFWDWDQKLHGHSVCWLTDRKYYPGEEVYTPDGTRLRLVKGFSLQEILSRKTKEL